MWPWVFEDKIVFNRLQEKFDPRLAPSDQFRAGSLPLLTHCPFLPIFPNQASILAGKLKGMLYILLRFSFANQSVKHVLVSPNYPIYLGLDLSMHCPSGQRTKTLLPSTHQSKLQSTPQSTLDRETPRAFPTNKWYVMKTPVRVCPLKINNFHYCVYVTLITFLPLTEYTVINSMHLITPTLSLAGKGTKWSLSKIVPHKML